MHTHTHTYSHTLCTHLEPSCNPSTICAGSGMPIAWQQANSGLPQLWSHHPSPLPWEGTCPGAVLKIVRTSHHTIHCQCAIIRVVLACWFTHVLHLSGLGLLKPVCQDHYKKKHHECLPCALATCMFTAVLHQVHHLEIMAESMTGAVGSNGPHQLHSKSFPKHVNHSVTRHIVLAFIPAWLVCQYNHVDLVNLCGVLLLYCWTESSGEVIL